MADPSHGMHDCMEAYNRQHLFFKGASGALWHNGNRWQAMQREGYPGDCLAGGGRFYFGFMYSNYLQLDLGVCAPAICDPDAISYVYFPVLHNVFFEHYHADIKYALRLREHREVTKEELLNKVQGPVLAVFCIAALLALLRWSFWALQLRQRSSRPVVPLRASLLVAGVLREVTMRTRWTHHSWHEANSYLFAAAKFLNQPWWTLSFRGAQALRVAALVRRRPGLLSCVAMLTRRLLELSSLSALAVATARVLQELVTVNVFAANPWNTSEFQRGLASCAALEPGWSYFSGGLTVPDLWGLLIAAKQEELPCPHLQPLREELGLLLVMAPLSLVVSILGLGPAALLALLLTSVFRHLQVAMPNAALLLELQRSLAALLAMELSGPDGRGACSLAVAIFSASAAALGACVSGLSPAAAASAVLPALLLAALAPLFGRSIGRTPLQRLEPLVDGIGAFLPLVIYALEGYLEPHAKALNPYDLLTRCFMVLLSTIFLSALHRSAWLCVCEFGELLLPRHRRELRCPDPTKIEDSSRRGEGATSLLATSLRVGLESSQGQSLGSVRIPLGVVVALAAAVILLLPRLSWHWLV